MTKSKAKLIRLTKLEKLGEILYKILRWIELKLFSLFSIFIGGLTLYYSNFFKVIFDDFRVNNFYLVSSIVFYTITFMIFLYLGLYLPYYLKIDEDKWDDYCPNMIPLATIFGLLGMASLIVSVWEVWRWLSFLIILTIKWGFIMTVNISPGGFLGSLMFIILLISILISGHIIEHEGILH